MKYVFVIFSIAIFFIFIKTEFNNNFLVVISLISLIIAFADKLSEFIKEINLREGKLILNDLKIAQREIKEIAYNLARMQLFQAKKVHKGMISYEQVDYVINQMPIDEKNIEQEVLNSLVNLKINNDKIDLLKKEFNIGEK